MRQARSSTRRQVRHCHAGASKRTPYTSRNHWLPLLLPALRWSAPWALLCLCRFRAVLALRAFLDFVLHPVTVIGVDRWMLAPFCAMNDVGIFKLLLQRFPFAASAELRPCGRYSSKLLIGTSGTWLNVELVMPALLMNVSPIRRTRRP